MHRLFFSFLFMNEIHEFRRKNIKSLEKIHTEWTSIRSLLLPRECHKNGSRRNYLMNYYWLEFVPSVQLSNKKTIMLLYSVYHKLPFASKYHWRWGVFSTFETLVHGLAYIAIVREVLLTVFSWLKICLRI